MGKTDKKLVEITEQRIKQNRFCFLVVIKK